MVIYRHGQKFLCPVLTYHILIKICMNILWLMVTFHLFRSNRSLRLVEIPEIVLGHPDAVCTDACIQSLKKKGNFLLASAAEHAVS